MPRKVPTKRYWKPIDLQRDGKSMYKDLPREEITKCLAEFPKWKELNDRRRSVARTVVFDAFLRLHKDRKDQKGFPRLRVVKANLRRIEVALGKLRLALGAMDLRTATEFKKVAGADAFANSPLNESPIQGGGAIWRGDHRVRLLTRALKNAQRWTKRTMRALPKQDYRQGDDGLKQFIAAIAYVWENYAPGERVAVSRNKGTWPHFVHRLLEAGGINCTRYKIEKCARIEVARRNCNHKDRIIVPADQRHYSLAELARRNASQKRDAVRNRIVAATSGKRRK